MNYLEQVYDQIGRACVHRTIDKALVVPTPWFQQPLADSGQTGQWLGLSLLPG